MGPSGPKDAVAATTDHSKSASLVFAAGSSKGPAPSVTAAAAEKPIDDLGKLQE